MGKEPAAKSEKQDIFFKNFTNKIKTSINWTCIEEFMKKNSLQNKDAHLKELLYFSG